MVDVRLWTFYFPAFARGASYGAARGQGGRDRGRREIPTLRTPKGGAAGKSNATHLSAAIACTIQRDSVRRCVFKFLYWSELKTLTMPFRPRLS